MVRAVRGATSLKLNSEKELQEKVCELFDLILEKNNLVYNDIISIIFSQTEDITFNPAKALRIKRGVTETALFCTQEPKCEDFTQPLMLRVLVSFESDKKNVENIYLGEALTLRKDRIQKK